MRVLLVGLAVLLAGSYTFLFIAKKDFCKRNWASLAIVLVAAVYGLFCLAYAGAKSLWYDDLAQVQFVQKGDSLLQMLRNTIARDGMPPLYMFFAALWLRIAPYGTVWMKLPSIVMVCAGIVLCAQAGRKWRGDWAGVFTAVIAAACQALTTNAAYTFRPYGLLFLLSSWAAYLLVVRANAPGNPRRRIVYTLCILLLAYAHYFGLLVVVCLFLVDSALSLRQREGFGYFVPYAVSAVLYLPWLYFGMLATLERWPSFWPQTPTLNSLYPLITSLASLPPTRFLLALGIAAALYTPAHKLLTSRRVEQQDILSAGIVAVPLLVIGLAFAYSAYINPSRSVFVERYFVSIMPFVFLLCAGGLATLCALVQGRARAMQTGALAAATLFLFCTLGSWHTVSRTQKESAHHPYEHTATWLLQQEDIWAEDVLLYDTDGYVSGFDYYLTRNGALPAPERYDAYDGQRAIDRLREVDRVYVFGHSHMLEDELNDEARAVLAQQFVLVHTEPVVNVYVYERSAERGQEE